MNLAPRRPHLGRDRQVHCHRLGLDLNRIGWWPQQVLCDPHCYQFSPPDGLVRPVSPAFHPSH